MEPFPKRFRNKSTITDENMVSQGILVKSVEAKPPLGSYNRKHDFPKGSFNYLLKYVLKDRQSTLEWCFENRLLPKQKQCEQCERAMTLSKCIKTSDKLRWRCQKNDHTLEKSVREGTWFEKSNLTIEEVIELTYWWSLGELFFGF